MAMINRNSLVLNNVSVVRDVVTGTMGNGIHQASCQAPAMPFSKRRLSRWFPQAVQEPAQRQCLADYLGGDSPAARAGRPGSPFRVLVTPSRYAGRLTGGESCSTNGVRASRFEAWRGPTSGRFQRCLSASHREALLRCISTKMLSARAYKRDVADVVRVNPATLAPTASTRG
jgi:hypothetical protein